MDRIEATVLLAVAAAGGGVAVYLAVTVLPDAAAAVALFVTHSG